MSTSSKSLANLRKQKNGAAEEVEQLRSRLQAAESALEAIRSGAVDALVIGADENQQVFTLRGAEEPYRLFVESMNEGAVTISPDGTILYCNRGFSELVGYPLERVIGAPISTFISAYDKDIFTALFTAAQAGSGKTELWLRHSEERLVPVYVSLRSFGEFGVPALCMVVTDLTEQKRSEQILSEGKLTRLIVEQAAEAMAVCDSQGKVILCNRGLEELFGEVTLFKDFDALISSRLTGPEFEGPAFDLEEVLAGQIIRGREVHLTKADNETAHLLMRAAPVRLPAGPMGCVITLLDITERKQAEATLRKSEKLAATGQLAATIAHEINNPLEAVMNLLYILRSYSGLPQAPLQLVEQAELELKRVVHITKQTLAFHRDARTPLPVDLTDLIESVLFLFERPLKQKCITLEKDFAFDGEIVCLESELRQVLSNLLGNAIDACPQSSRIRLRTMRGVHPVTGVAGVKLVIADEGKGIAAADRQRIFSPFFTTKGERGTGLGLWVTQTIVEKHGGSIRLRSRQAPGRSGTVFSIFLPREGAHARPRESGDGEMFRAG